LRQPHFTSVKGAPDVVIQRCAFALWHGDLVPVATVRDEILAANRQLSERFVVITVVIGFIVDVPDPGVMQRPPRQPGTKIVNRPQVIRWFVTGFVVAATALAVLEWGPGKPSTEHGSTSMTMAFAIVSFSAVNIGLVLRRERQAPWASPVFPYLGWIILGWVITWAAVELGMLQRLLDTVSLSGRQWVVVLALSLLAPAVVAVDKAIQLARQREARA
jgi:Ca2+-transporting ATPase